MPATSTAQSVAAFSNPASFSPSSFDWDCSRLTCPLSLATVSSVLYQTLKGAECLTSELAPVPSTVVELLLPLVALRAKLRLPLVVELGVLHWMQLGVHGICASLARALSHGACRRRVFYASSLLHLEGGDRPSVCAKATRRWCARPHAQLLVELCRQLGAKRAGRVPKPRGD